MGHGGLNGEDARGGGVFEGLAVGVEEVRRAIIEEEVDQSMSRRREEGMVMMEGASTEFLLGETS